MNTESAGILIGVISGLTAVISVAFAWRAVHTAERTYSLEVLTQIYNLYHSESMLADIQTVWGLYQQVWARYCETKEEAIQKVNRGIPIAKSAAKDFIETTSDKSPEYQAVHNVMTFWIYIVLLSSQNVLDVRYVTSFSTPRILGFVYPVEEAYAKHYELKNDYRISLKHFYEQWQLKYTSVGGS